MTLKSVGVSAAFVLMMIGISQAEEPLIIAPVSAAARTTWDGTSSGQPRFVSPQYLIDSSGLTGTGLDAVHSCANTSNLFWHSDGGTAVSNQWLEFDLGATYRVTNALIWQLAQYGLTSRGVQSFSILVAGPDKAYTVLSDSNQLSRAENGVTAPVQSIPLVADGVQWIRFNIHTNWGDSAFVGLSEVRFEAYPAPQIPLVRIMSPASATASTIWTGTPGFVSPNYLIDKSGLTGIGRDAVHSYANSSGLFWHSNTGIVVSNQWLEFDLGMVCDVTNALVWQLAQQSLTSRGVKDFNIMVAGEDQIFYACTTGHLTQANGTTNEPVQIVPFITNGVRYIRFDIQSNWGGGSIVGLSEVAFEIVRVHPDTNDLTLPYVAASASSTYQRSGFDASPTYLVDNSGLIGTGRNAQHVNTDASALFWHSNTNTVSSDQWLEFDLGASYDLRHMLLWQLAQTNHTSRGIKIYSVETAGTNRVFATVITSNVLSKAWGTVCEPVQWTSLAATAARYVRLDIHSNWGASDAVGLSEVKFETAYPTVKTNGVFRTQVSAQASSASASNSVSRLIDESGLTGNGLAATLTNGLGQSGMWLSGFSAITNEWLEFDLGREVDLDAAAVWQYNQTVLPDSSLAAGSLKRGVRGMSVCLAGKDHVYSEYGFFGLAMGGGSAAEPVQLIGLKADQVRYVKFAINANWGDSCYVGLGEVKFLYTRHDGTLIRIY